MSNEYIQEVKIDKLSLDTEWERQPSLYEKWARRWVLAQDRKEYFDNQLELTRARLDTKIRTNYGQYGWEKAPTEPAIKAWIISQPEYQTALEAFNKAHKEMNLLSVAVKAFDHKKKGLENLTRLFLSGYYSDLTSSGQGQGIMEDANHGALRQSVHNNERLKERLCGVTNND